MWDARVGARVRRMQEQNAEENRPLKASDVTNLAFQSAKRDNPQASPTEISRAVTVRMARGAQPHIAAVAPTPRSPTAADLHRASRKAAVRGNRHLRRS